MTEVYVSACCGTVVAPGSADYDDIVEYVGPEADAVREGACPACEQRRATLDLLAEVDA